MVTHQAAPVVAASAASGPAIPLKCNCAHPGKQEAIEAGLFFRDELGVGMGTFLRAAAITETTTKTGLL
ncbi:MAG: hypothetical protein LRY56_00735 [Burkholderiaceae bacterium]|nr:hypothetical protein [Burkholderiaceae bacterium]